MFLFQAMEWYTTRSQPRNSCEPVLPTVLGLRHFRHKSTLLPNNMLLIRTHEDPKVPSIFEFSTHSQYILLPFKRIQSPVVDLYIKSLLPKGVLKSSTNETCDPWWYLLTLVSHKWIFVIQVRFLIVTEDFLSYILMVEMAVR